MEADPTIATKSLADLEKCIPNFQEFTAFISKYKHIVDTGRLAEYYCERLFALQPVKPRNSEIDALSPIGERIEIKYRFFPGRVFPGRGRVPPGMKINLQIIDSVFYVELQDDLLPARILKFDARDLKNTTGKRVSFKSAYREQKFEALYEYHSSHDGASHHPLFEESVR